MTGAAIPDDPLHAAAAQVFVHCTNIPPFLGTIVAHQASSEGRIYHVAAGSEVIVVHHSALTAIGDLPKRALCHYCGPGGLA